MCAAIGHKGYQIARGKESGKPGAGSRAVRTSLSRAVPDTQPGGNRAPPGTSPNFPSFIIKTQRSEGWLWEIYNLLAVNRALSGDDAPACLKHPENKVPTIYIFRIGASIRSRLSCVYKIRSFVRGMTSSDP